jgi:beta-xylosidase
MNQHIIRNPIIGGFYPDPSICRVGSDFYLVTSSFELYPGIPIFHSKDLANWEQIGYVMTKSNGFHVGATTYTGGVMAPTIRYHKGTYYVINTNFADRGNYIVTATDPKGPWSEPH